MAQNNLIALRDSLCETEVGAVTQKTANFEPGPKAALRTPFQNCRLKIAGKLVQSGFILTGAGIGHW